MREHDGFADSCQHFFSRCRKKLKSSRKFGSQKGKLHLHVLQVLQVLQSGQWAVLQVLQSGQLVSGTTGQLNSGAVVQCDKKELGAR